ncbi:hypothetical protein D3C76_1601360 [compost metagenome]
MGNANIDAYTTDSIPAVLPDRRNLIEFLILAYILLPFDIAFTIVEKLSSASTIEAASFATSVPVIPIAIPISACFKAGASFTPSPVIATIFPFSCHALTILILCSGDTLA